MDSSEEYKVDRLKIVPIENVKPNPWNPKNKDTEQYKTVLRGIKAQGFRQPIIVRETDKEGFYEILDGEQRWTAANELGYKNIPIYNMGEVSDKEAKSTTLWMEVHVPLDRVLQAQLVVDMVNTYDNLMLPYSDAEVDNMIKIIEYDPDMLMDEEFEAKDEPDMDKLIVKLTKEQLEVVRGTIKSVQEELDCSEGRALELICADYNSGHNFNDPEDEEEKPE